MSLQTRLADLVVDLGSDFKRLLGGVNTITAAGDFTMTAYNLNKVDSSINGSTTVNAYLTPSPKNGMSMTLENTAPLGSPPIRVTTSDSTLIEADTFELVYPGEFALFKYKIESGNGNFWTRRRNYWRNIPGTNARRNGLGQISGGDATVMENFANKRYADTYSYCVYNATDAALRNSRLSLSKTIAGVSSTIWVTTGDSSLGGYNGGSYDTTLAMPRQAAMVAAMAAGVNFYDGISTANAGSGVNERWVISGGGGVTSVTQTGNNFLTLNTTGYVEHTSSPGTTVDVYFSDLSTSGGMTWSIDGVSQGSITTTGTATWKKLTVANLGDVSHKVRFTWVSGTVYVGGAWGRNPTRIGLYLHNLSLGGATTNTGTAFYNWSDTSAQGLKASHVGMYNLATSNAVPDLHIISVGGNDFNTSGTTNAGTMAGIANMKAFFACNVVTVHAYSPTPNNPSGWGELNALKYAHADSYGNVHFDWDRLVGTRVTLSANSSLGSDGVHAKHEINIQAGRALGQALVAFADPPNNTPPIPEKGYSPPSGFAQMPTNLLSLTGSSLTSQRACFWPIDIGPVARVATGMIVSVSTAQVAGTGTLVKGGLYFDNGSGGGPLLSTAGLIGQVTFVVTSTGVRVTSFTSPIPLPPGRYWVCGLYYAGSTAPTTPPIILCGSNATSLWSSITALQANRYLALTAGVTDLPTSGTLQGLADAAGIVCGLILA